MGNNTWVNLLDPTQSARGTTKNTFTSLQDVYGLTNRPDLLPSSYANELKLGTRIRVQANGDFSTTGTPTIQFGILYGATPNAAGGVSIGLTAATTTGSGAAAWPWFMDWLGIITQTGGPSSLGVIYGSGVLKLGTSLTAFTDLPMPNTAAARSASIDTSVQKQWGLGCAFSASSASNQVTVDVFNVEILNQGKT